MSSVQSVVSQIVRLSRWGSSSMASSKQRRAESDPGGGGLAGTALLQEEQFTCGGGVGFEVQLIGSMDIPRPTTRLEIVAAMRRIRFEFKSKGIKKRSVRLQVGVDGVGTLLRRKDRSSGSQQNIVLKEHPIHRIFYVSHDSQDPKIFSYIARESNTALFHCCVYKAKRKRQALRIVRTIGQAFEICSKVGSASGANEGSGADLDQSANANASKPGKSADADPDEDSGQHSTPSFLARSTRKQSTFMRSSLKAQLQLLRDQLAVETAARIEAQTRVEELLIHNQELLEHLERLVSHINELDAKRSREQVEASVPPLTPLSKIERWFEKNNSAAVAGQDIDSVHLINNKGAGSSGGTLWGKGWWRRVFKSGQSSTSGRKKRRRLRTVSMQSL